MEMVAAAVATAVELPRPPSRPPERHVPQCRQRHWLRTGAKGEMDEESELLDISLISG